MPVNYYIPCIVGYTPVLGAAYIAIIKPSNGGGVAHVYTECLGDELFHLLYTFTLYEKIKSMEETITNAWTIGQKVSYEKHIRPLLKVLKVIEEKNLKNDMERTFTYNLAEYRDRLLKIKSTVNDNIIDENVDEVC